MNILIFILLVFGVMALILLIIMFGLLCIKFISWFGGKILKIKEFDID